KGNLTKERDEDGHTPLHYAAHKGCSSVVEELLKWDASAAYVCDRKWEMTPLLMAARQGHLQILRKIHSFCPDSCEKVDKRGWNLLHYLAFRVYHPSIAIFSFTLSQMECASIRNLMDWKDALGITPHQVYDAYRPRIARARKSFENSGQKEIKKQIAELLKDIVSEEVAEWPVSHFSLPTVSAESLDKTRDAHLVVAGLIATITFAAAITVPGGLQTEKGSERGTPLLIDEAAFKAFVVTNAMAFILSVSALSIHFEIVNLLLSKLIFWRADMIVSRTQSVSNLLGRAVIAMKNGISIKVKVARIALLRIMVCECVPGNGRLRNTKEESCAVDQQKWNYRQTSCLYPRVRWLHRVRWQPRPIIAPKPEEREQNISYMDASLYKAAAEGKIEVFNNYQELDLESQKTPNHDNVLHVNLATHELAA
ncbi:hypothetical protein Gotur_020925, partial [Gossypium turneri]